MDLKGAIFINLNIWGERHTELKNLQKALPDHLRGSKESKEAIKDPLNNNFILIKMSTREYYSPLNTHKQKEIYEFLGGFNKD